MSVNDKKINDITNDNIIEEKLKPNYFTFSSENSPNDNKKTNNMASTPFSIEQNSKVNIKNKTNKIKIAEFSTNYQTFSPIRQSFSPNDENIPISDNSKKEKDIYENNNDNKSNQIINFPTNFETFSNDKIDFNNEIENIIDEKIKDIYKDTFNNKDIEDIKDLCTFQKPKLSLKDSRTKLKQLRDKLYPLSEEEKISIQSELLPVPVEKMNDEKYKILKMHYLKKPSLPEYKSCQKYDEYYKPFEDSLNKKNEYYFLKKKKSIYSNTKFMKLEINLKNKNNEKNFPLYKDQDIGVYEYWQVPLIESKIDEDIDSDEEQIKLAQKVCELDLLEGIKYIKNNGINSLIHNRFKKKEVDSNIKCKSVSK